jgi:hypothetical protein
MLALFNKRQDARRKSKALAKEIAGLAPAPVFEGMSSFGYPLLNGEKEIRDHIIQDKNGREWTINSKGFFKNKHINNENIKVSVAIDGEKMCVTANTNIDNTDWIGKMIDRHEKNLMGLFGEKYEIKKIKLFGINACATSDDYKCCHVYSKNETVKYDLSGKGLAFNVRFKIIWNDGSEAYDDTPLAFFKSYDNSLLRAKRGASEIAKSIVVLDRDIVRTTFERRVRVLHGAKHSGNKQ